MSGGPWAGTVAMNEGMARWDSIRNDELRALGKGARCGRDGFGALRVVLWSQGRGHRMLHHAELQDRRLH